MILDRLIQHLQQTKVELLEIKDSELLEERESTKSFVELFYSEISKYIKTILLR